MKGSYILVIYLKDDDYIKVGKLGKISFQKGYYVYVGSAMGDKGSTTLNNRIARHLQKSGEKKLFWHIDYLLNSSHSKIVKIYLIPSKIRQECMIAKKTFNDLKDLFRNIDA
ncbi:MAG: GIY-YIG nuclease family protein [Promethearchaeota archaeon]